MKIIMSVAAGLAIGYFIYQMIVKKNKGEEISFGRLHKSTKDKKLAGVCGGLAETLNTDPTLVRLAFALLVFGWGSGVLVYIALALLLPDGEGQE